MQDILTSLEAKADPRHTALLVIDMQNDFCAKGGYVDTVLGRSVDGNDALAERIMRLVAAARAGGVPVVWIKAIYDPKYLAPPTLAKQEQNGVAGKVLCGEGSWGADFFGVAPEAGELEIEKHRYSAFSGTELDNILRANGIKTLVCTGVATNVCVDSTLRDGFFAGYYIVVPQDCVDSYAKALHQATLDNVRALFGDVVESGDLIALWQGAKARAAAE